MKELVIDASVAVKWFIKEDGDIKAKRLLRSVKSGLLSPYVPQIFFFEVGNIISLHTELTLSTVNRFLESLFSLGLKTENVTRGYLGRVTEVSRHYNITAYDAAYVALAQLLGLTFLTADQKLKERVKLPFIKLL